MISALSASDPYAAGQFIKSERQLSEREQPFADWEIKSN